MKEIIISVIFVNGFDSWLSWHYKGLKMARKRSINCIIKFWFNPNRIKYYFVTSQSFQTGFVSSRMQLCGSCVLTQITRMGHSPDVPGALCKQPNPEDIIFWDFSFFLIQANPWKWSRNCIPWCARRRFWWRYLSLADYGCTHSGKGHFQDHPHLRPKASLQGTEWKYKYLFA